MANTGRMWRRYRHHDPAFGLENNRIIRNRLLAKRLSRMDIFSQSNIVVELVSGFHHVGLVRQIRHLNRENCKVNVEYKEIDGRSW